MGKRIINDAIAELDDILDREKEALLTGKLDTIGPLLEQKERLVDELSEVEAADAGMVSGVAGKLQRNQELLEHAVDGIRSVSNRLAALRRVREALDTYDSRGVKTSIKIAQDSALEKRA